MNPTRATRLVRSIQINSKVARSARKYSTLPLTEPLPTVPPQSDAPLSKPVLQTSVLENGIRVATIASQVPVAAVGVYVEAGSRYENLGTSGTSFALKNMAFGSTHHRTATRLAREFDVVGASFTVSAGREHMGYTSEMSSDRVGDIVPLLADVLNPRLAEFELRDEKERLGEETREIQSDARRFLFETLHAEAYRNKGLGMPLYIPEVNLGELTTKNLRDYIRQFYSADRTVVTAVGGVDHSAFVKLVADSFGSLRKGEQKVSTPAAEYYGGEYRQAINLDTMLAVAFQGVSWADKDVYALTVLQSLLGGWANGLGNAAPGVGITSRLGSKVSGPISEISTFNVNYSDSGLFGVFAQASKGNAGRLSEIILNELRSVASSSSASDLSRAISQAKASVLFKYQLRTPLLDFIGQQAVGRRTPEAPDTFAAALESVTAEDVLRVAKRVLSSRPTVVAIGDVVDVPSVSDVQKAVKA